MQSEIPEIIDRHLLPTNKRAHTQHSGGIEDVPVLS